MSESGESRWVVSGDNDRRRSCCGHALRVVPGRIDAARRRILLQVLVVMATTLDSARSLDLSEYNSYDIQTCCDLVYFNY